MPDEKKNHIVKEGDKYRLLSHDGKNLGTFDTHEEAAKHEGDVEYFKEHQNAGQTQKPNFYYVKHMQPGVCKYSNEMVLVDVEAMQAMIASGAGIPVYIHHQVGVPIDKMKSKACGFVTESFYNELDGWAWFKIIAIDDELRLAVANGWKVSNAYAPTQFGGGGTKNNVPFDRKIILAEFTHLAIVPNPRYEDACIMTPEQFKAYQENLKSKLVELQNSLPTSETPKGNPMLKLLRLLTGKTEEVTNSADATHVMREDGKVLTVAEAAELLNAKTKKNEGDEGKEATAREAEAKAEEKENEVCDVDGEKMTIKDMKNAVRKMKKNEADDKAKEEKKNADEKAAKDAEEKKNADEKAKKDAEEAEKTNGKGYFDQLLNAHESGIKPDVMIVDTGMNQTARGASRYGSGK